MATVPPTGTVTFMFTDIEGSTRLWEDQTEEMEVALRLHDQILRAAIEAKGGYLFSTGGDAFCVAFARAADGVGAAVEVQRGLEAARWPGAAAIRVRIGLHTGEAQERDGDFFGPAVIRAARLMALGHGGQILLSDSTHLIAGTSLPIEIIAVDLGLHALKDMFAPERVWEVRGDALASGFGPLKSPVARFDLPVVSSPLVGRTDELRDVQGVLNESSLVTLSGPGGVGKTRIAVELALRVSPDFSDGVVIVELAGVANPEAVAAIVAGGVGAIQPGMSPLDAVVDWLSNKQALIVLDNCEHVIDAVAEAIERIIAGCPEVRIVATSREPIGVLGERVWRVPSLEPRTYGVELFCVRASAADSLFDPSDVDVAAIASICERLDGIPLAIELAAARTRSMSVYDVADRLDDRFRLLRAGRRGVERQQTLHATVDWSYRLLDETEQQLFAAMSVFAGGFDLAAAERIGGAVASGADVALLVGELVDKSMVEFERNQGRGRYRILETLRQFGEERLAASQFWDVVHDEHMGHYITVAKDAFDWFTGEDWDGGKAVFIAEWDNIRTALNWALTNRDLESAEQLAAAAARFGTIQVRHEHEEWLANVLALASELGKPPPPAIAGCQAWWHNTRFRADEARRFALAGIEAAPSSSDASTNWCWFALWMTTQQVEELTSIVARWDAASATSPDPFDRCLFAWCHTLPAAFALDLEADARAEWAARAVDLLEDSVAATSNPAPRVWLASARGVAAFIAGDIENAVDSYAETIDESQAVGHHVLAATTAMFLAAALSRFGGPIDPAIYSRTIAVAHRYRTFASGTLGALAAHLLRNGHFEQGSTLHGYVTHSGLTPTVNLPDMPEATRWSSSGTAMNLDQAVAYALEVLTTL